MTKKKKTSISKFPKCSVCEIKHTSISTNCSDKIDSLFNTVVDFWGEKHVGKGIKGNKGHQNIYDAYAKYHRYVINNFDPDHKYIVLK